MTQPRSDFHPPAPTRRKGKTPAQLSSSMSQPPQSTQHPSRPPERLTHSSPRPSHRHRPSQHPPRPSERSTNIQSRGSHLTNLLVLPSLADQPGDTHHLPSAFFSSPPSPLSDGPTPSSDPDSPTLSPVVNGVLPSPFDRARLPFPTPSIAGYAHFVVLDLVPGGLTATIRQDRATGINDEWFYVVRGRKVGIFNNQ